MPITNSSPVLSRVLIVDDERMARETLEALLFREGYELLFASSGIDALQRVKELAPDVILLDVMMPHMNGFEVCKYLRKMPECCHIPIILVTALDGPDALARGIDAGADEFISKPVNSLELKARVRSMLRIKLQYDELERTLYLRELLSNMIVHDMRNPLAAILLYIQMLKRRGTITPDQVKYFELIQSEAQQLNTFLDDILMLAKMEKGKLLLTCVTLDMLNLIGELEKKYAPMATSQNIEFVITDAANQVVPILVDVNLFQRVLDNLLSNALKFSEAHGTVRVQIDYPRRTSAQADLPTLRICVYDEGPGIPSEDLERIFDKYEVVDMHKTGKTQLGLGLAFCKMVIEAHGGKIYAHNNVAKGVVFTVEV